MRRWYGAGLRFDCTACGRCCASTGGRDTVFVNLHEERRIAACLGLGLAGFRRRYTTRSATGDRILRSRGAACVFLDGQRCTIYAARPVQCRSWPFWPENVASRRAWGAVVRDCPGSGRGTLRAAAVIDRAVLALERSDRGEPVAPQALPDPSPPSPPERMPPAAPEKEV